jgi:hypothetical protein
MASAGRPVAAVVLTMQRVVEPSAMVRGSCSGRIHPGGLLGEDGRAMVG